MQNQLLFTALLLSIAALAGAQKPIAGSVYFDTDQSELKPESHQTLERLFVRLDRMPDYDISIEAYTDDRGTADYNKALAGRRAEAVRTFLVARGYQPRKVTITPVGISKNQGSGKIAESRRLNRRVDVTVTPNLIDDLSELGEKTAAPQRDEFTLAPGQEAIFTSRSGVKLKIPAGAFVLSNGKAPDGPVTVRLQEAARPMDWILQGLSTHTSDGEILQTGGMYHIEALAGERKLQLRPGASVSLSAPMTERPDPEMEIFYGVRDDKGAIAWESAARREPNISGNSAMDALRLRRYRLFDSMRTKFSEVRLAKPKRVQAPLFSSERLRRSGRRPPKAPLMREPRLPVEPVALAPMAENDEEAKRLQQKDREAMRLYRKKMDRYRDKMTEYRQRWTKYRADSTAYETSRHYREECLKKLQNYENALHDYYLKSHFNNRVAEFLYFYWANSFTNNMTDISRVAQRSMLGYTCLKERNKLRRKLRQPLLSAHCHYDTARDSLICGDPDEQAWLQRGNALLKDICESSGYNRIYAEIKARYEQLLEEAKQKATEDIQNLSEYTFEVNRMGWINIDKFYKYPEADRVPLVVSESASDTRVYVVFREFRGALALNYTNGRFVSPPLPKGIPVTIVALKLQSGSPQLLLIDMNVGESATAKKGTYETLTLKQLQEKMAVLNS